MVWIELPSPSGSQGWFQPWLLFHMSLLTFVRVGVTVYISRWCRFSGFMCWWFWSHRRVWTHLSVWVGDVNWVKSPWAASSSAWVVQQLQQLQTTNLSCFLEENCPFWLDSCRETGNVGSRVWGMRCSQRSHQWLEPLYMGPAQLLG